MEQKTALLVMDMQLGILSNFPNPEKIIKNVAEAIEIARARDIPVIYVTLGFRNGISEISHNNKLFAPYREHLKDINLDEFSTIHPQLTPKDDDIRIMKRRISAFTGSELEVVLRSNGIQHIILTGVATGGIVLSTTTEAADKDYKISILSNACADRDEEVHHVLTTKILTRHANLMTIEEWKNS